LAFQQRRADYRFAVLFLDIDRFKTVNESLGHTQGDVLLVQIAQRLREVVRPGDTVARLGGDEFALLLGDFTDPEEPVHTAGRVQKVLAAPYDLEGTEVFATASIGVAVGSRAYAHPEELLRDADTAMYRAKDLGRARHAVFDSAMHALARAQLQLDTDLRRAIEREELRLKLEVTESAIMEHAGSAALLLNQLKALTVGLLLDDFGTGYSSLSYLHNFRFDTLKIDRSFVARLEQSGKQAEIVRTIVSFARALQMDVVAEGVENAGQLKQLQALEVHSAQGYWFSRALDAKAFLELLEARKAFLLPGTPRLTDAG